MNSFKFPRPPQYIDHPLEQPWLDAIEVATQVAHWPVAVLTTQPMEIIHSSKIHGQIEDLEHTLMRQQHSGVIYYQVLAEQENRKTTLLTAQLIEAGTTRWMWYAPVETPDQWWVEPWSVHDLLSKH